MNRIPMTPLLFGLLTLAGCAAATAPGSTYHLSPPLPWGSGTIQTLTPCSPNPAVGTIQCDVVITNNPADAEAWMFEARLRQYMQLGIPIGRSPVDYLIVGRREHCEAARASAVERIPGWERAMAYVSSTRLFFSGEGETPPTEACRGPYYFRRLPQPADATR